MKKETIVTIVIFILLTIAIVIAIRLISQNYREGKLLLNGRVLCAQIMSTSISYYKHNGKYLVNDKVSFNEEYPLDARTNPYFSLFSTYPIDENTQGISVFGTIDNTDYELKVIFNKDDEPQSLRNIKIQTIKHKK
ncbi:MAG: hypothetical protein K5622_01265 [Endomicrobiaceae bacterium]|nr:hypothetical protein [Endomicrobiaceae bacterium]